MKKVMMKVTTKANDIVYMVVIEKVVEATKEQLKEMVNDIKTFEVGKMPLEELPENVQKDVKSTLRAYSDVDVEYEYGKWSVGGCSIRAHYNYDHYVAGTYKAKEVYTLEERKQNFIEEFGYAPCYMV